MTWLGPYDVCSKVNVNIMEITAILHLALNENVSDINEAESVYARIIRIISAKKKDRQTVERTSKHIQSENQAGAPFQ